MASSDTSTSADITIATDAPVTTAITAPRTPATPSSVLSTVGAPQLATLSSSAQHTALLDKAALLLGMADALGTVDPARRSQMEGDAQRLFALASTVHSQVDSDGSQTRDALATAQKLIDGLAAKYAVEGDQLLTEGTALWNEVSSSSEAKDFMAQGEKVVEQWKKYGETKEGAALLSSVTTAVGDNAGEWLDIISKFTSQSIDAGTAAVNDGKLISEAGDTAAAATAAITSDADVAAILASGKQLFDKTTSTDTPAGDDPVRNAAVQGKQVLADLRQSQLAQQALKQGTALLSDLQANMTPEELVAQAKGIYNDAATRNKFIVKIKDAALDFLLQYLPTVQVPVIKGEKKEHSVEYELDHIDLKGFKVKSENVDVVLTDTGIQVDAKDISCEMKDLIWKYKKLTFPYARGEGHANAIATQVTFHLHLETVWEDPETAAENDAKLAAEVKAKEAKEEKAKAEAAAKTAATTTPTVSTTATAAATAPAKGTKKPTPPAKSPPPPSRPVPPSSAPPSSAAVPTTAATTTTPATPTTTPATTPATAASTTTTTPLSPRPKPPTARPPQSAPPPPQKSATTTSDATTPGSSPAVAPSSSPSPPATPATPSTTTVTTTSSPTTTVSSPAVSHRPAPPTDAASALASGIQWRISLAVRSCKINIGEMTIKVEAKWLGWAYNALLGLFRSAVKEYVESALNDAITERSAELLKTINDATREYLPLLYKLKDKGEGILKKVEAKTKEPGTAPSRSPSPPAGPPPASAAVPPSSPPPASIAAAAAATPSVTITAATSPPATK